MSSLSAGADIVIVGAGMAGLAVAAELAMRTSASIMVLESGPDAGRRHIRRAAGEEDRLNLWLSPESDPHFWRPYVTDGPHYLGLSGLRRRVGGRSLYWGGALVPIENWALDGAWPAPVAADLVETWRGGPSLFARVATDIDSWAAAAPIPSPSPLIIGSTAFQPTPHAMRAANGGSTIYSPLEKITAESKSILIVPQCHALGIVLRGGRAMGVRVRRMGQDADVGASQIVLAGGTVENSRLAIQALSDANALETHRLTGLVDKIAHGFAFSCASEKVPRPLREAAALGATFHCPLGAGIRSNHFVRLWTRRDGNVAFDTWLMGEQERSEASGVNCAPAAQWPWPTRVTAALTAEDERLCAKQQEILVRFWEDIREAFGMPESVITFDPIFGSPNLSERLRMASSASVRLEPVTYSFPLGSEQHEAGTIPLGTLLDDAHEFRAVPGLSVAGPSSFPRTGAANPAMTILALSMRLAGQLAAR